MRNPFADTIVNIKPSGIRKFFDIVNEMEGAISLGVGEPDFDTPWHIRDEGIYSLEKGRTFYTSNAGLKELKIEIAKYLFRNYDLQYDYQHEIVVTVGGSEAIDIAMQQSDDEMLLYAYMKQKSMIETDSSLSGEEKTQELEKIAQKMQPLMEKYDTEEE